MTHGHAKCATGPPALCACPWLPALHSSGIQSRKAVEFLRRVPMALSCFETSVSWPRRDTIRVYRSITWAEKDTPLEKEEDQKEQSLSLSRRNLPRPSLTTIFLLRLNSSNSQKHDLLKSEANCHPSLPLSAHPSCHPPNMCIEGPYSVHPSLHPPN